MIKVKTALPRAGQLFADVLFCERSVLCLLRRNTLRKNLCTFSGAGKRNPAAGPYHSLSLNFNFRRLCQVSVMNRLEKLLIRTGIARLLHGDQISAVSFVIIAG